MKYCNLNCKHLHTNLIERCGEGTRYEYRCMAKKGMPKVTIDTYCPYDEVSETKQETNTEVEELKQELEVYKKALEMACSFDNNNPICTEEYKDCCKSLGSCGECWEKVYLQKARENNE